MLPPLSPLLTHHDAVQGSPRIQFVLSVQFRPFVDEYSACSAVDVSSDTREVGMGVTVGNRDSVGATVGSGVVGAGVGWIEWVGTGVGEHVPAKSPVS